MRKIYLLCAVVFALITYFTYYMFTDEKLSEDAKYWIAQAKPAQNIENNVFIHLMALGETNKEAYELHKRDYLEKVALAEERSLYVDEKVIYPRQLIAEGELPMNLYCFFGDKKCLEEIESNEGFLRQSLQARILVVEEFIENSASFDFEQLDSHSSIGNFDGFYAFNYLASLSVYFDILDGNTHRAEQTLFQHFALVRKVAESSLDLFSSVIFMVSIEQLFQPLLEKLVSSGHQFNSQSLELFSEIPMREISLQKLAISEFNMMYRAVTVYLQPSHFVEGELASDWATAIGYKPISTLNKIANFWKVKTVPKGTLKRHYLRTNKIAEAVTAKQGERDPFSIVLNNPRNFIGELLIEAATPRFIGVGYDYAATDLNLLLFKMLIQSQVTPIDVLIGRSEFEDPYTGSTPYLIDSELCYPAWKELDTEELKQEPICISIP